MFSLSRSGGHFPSEQGVTFVRAQRGHFPSEFPAGASANGVRKVVFTPPRMSTLGADVRAVRPLDGVMLEAMTESVCPLCGGQFGQSLA